MSQSTYALKLNKVTVRARARPEDMVTTAEVRSLRELAKESRPDLAVQVSMSRRALSDARVRQARHGAPSEAAPRSGVPPVPLDDLRLVMRSDAAFQNAHGGASQAGYIIAVTDDRLAKRERLRRRVS